MARRLGNGGNESGRELRFRDFPTQNYREWAEQLRSEAARMDALADAAKDIGVSMLQVDGAVGMMGDVFAKLKKVRKNTRKAIAGLAEMDND